MNDKNEKSDFILKKWYLDAADEAGHIYIGYWAFLQWQKLSLHFFQHLYCEDKKGVRMESGLTKQSEPEMLSSERLVWQTADLNGISLSNLYAAATSQTERSQYLAAGEALLALFNGTAWILNTFLGTISLLISSLMMLRSRIFSKATAYVGIVTNLVTLGFFLPTVGIFLLFLSLPFMVVWDIQLARRFFQLGRLKAEA